MTTRHSPHFLSSFLGSPDSKNWSGVWTAVFLPLACSLFVRADQVLTGQLLSLCTADDNILLKQVSLRSRQTPPPSSSGNVMYDMILILSNLGFPNIGFYQVTLFPVMKTKTVVTPVAVLEWWYLSVQLLSSPCLLTGHG